MNIWEELKPLFFRERVSPSLQDSGGTWKNNGRDGDSDVDGDDDGEGDDGNGEW